MALGSYWTSKIWDLELWGQVKGEGHLKVIVQHENVPGVLVALGKGIVWLYCRRSSASTISSLSSWKGSKVRFHKGLGLSFVHSSSQSHFQQRYLLAICGLLRACRASWVLRRTAVTLIIICIQLLQAFPALGMQDHFLNAPVALHRPLQVINVAILEERWWKSSSKHTSHQAHADTFCWVLSIYTLCSCASPTTYSNTVKVLFAVFCNSVVLHRVGLSRLYCGCVLPFCCVSLCGSTDYVAGHVFTHSIWTRS